MSVVHPNEVFARAVEGSWDDAFQLPNADLGSQNPQSQSQGCDTR